MPSSLIGESFPGKITLSAYLNTLFISNSIWFYLHRCHTLFMTIQFYSIFYSILKEEEEKKEEEEDKEEDDDEEKEEWEEKKTTTPEHN